MNAYPHIKPIVDAIAAGIPLGKLKPGEQCPRLPATPMMVVVDDANGKGPSAFDSSALFDQVNSVVIVMTSVLAAGASAVAARARTGDRALLVQTKAETLAQWLALISERRKLAHNFLILGAGDQELPADAALMLRDIGALASGAVN
jgi:hypothetical protein